MVENFPDIIYFLNPEGYFSLAGGDFERLLGFTPEDLTGKHFTSIVWPKDVEKACWHVNERRTGRRATKRLELRLATKHGKGEPFGIRYLTVEMNACGMYDKRVSAKDKNFLGTYGVARDIAARKRTQDALRESEERYRSLYENAPNPYFSISAADGSILRCNRAAVRLLGYDKETMSQMKLFDFYADTPDGIGKAQEVFRHFKAGESIRDIELQMRHKDGNPIWVIVSVEAARDRDGKITESRLTVIDISERKRLESQLQQAQKMEAIASLAIGVAHDLNNILSGISGYTQLLVMDKKASDPEYDNLRQIQSLIQKAGDLTRNILAFTRQTASEPQACDLNKDTKRGP